MFEKAKLLVSSKAQDTDINIPACNSNCIAGFSAKMHDCVMNLHNRSLLSKLLCHLLVHFLTLFSRLK